VLRAIGTLLFSIIGCAIMAQPIYFDDLYLFDDRGEGIGIGGTQKISTGYVNWNSGFFAGQLPSQQSLFTVNFQGTLMSSVELPFIDTIRGQSGNLLVVNDTTVVVMSYEQIITEQSSGDFVLYKMSTDGTIHWKKRYGQANRLDIPQRVSKTQEGGFIITGQATIEVSGDTDGQVLLVKTNSDGSLSWNKLFGGSQFDNGADIVQTPEGGYLILGWTRSFGAGQRDFYLVKTDSQGLEQWHKTYGAGTDEGGTSIILLSDGNYLLTGSGSNPIVSGSIGKVYKVEPGGDAIWSESYTYQANGSNNLHETVELSDGSLVSAGATGAGGSAGWLVKTNNLGEVIWQREYDKNSGTDLFYSVLATDDGGFLLSGQAINEATNSQDAWLLKVDSIGCPYPNCTVGIDEKRKTVLVDVWPNPCTDVLNVELLDPSAALRVAVMDINGKEILRFTQNDTRESIDVSSWPSGIYILNGTDDKGRSFYVKVVKQ
jgi:hypothetical protein